MPWPAPTNAYRENKKVKKIKNSIKKKKNIPGNQPYGIQIAYLKPRAYLT